MSEDFSLDRLASGLEAEETDSLVASMTAASLMKSRCEPLVP